MNSYFTGFLIKFPEMWMKLPHIMQYKVSWKNSLTFLFWPNDSPRWMWNQDADPILPVPSEEMEISVKGGNSERKFLSLSLLSNEGALRRVGRHSDSAVGEEDFKQKTPFLVPRASCLQDNTLLLEFSHFSLPFAVLFSSHFVGISLLQQTH